MTLTCSVPSPELFLLPIPTLMPTSVSPGCILHAVGPPVHDDPPVPRFRGRHCHLPLPRPLRRLLHHHHGPHRLRAGGAHAGVPGHRVPHGADGRAHDRGHAHSRLVTLHQDPAAGRDVVMAAFTHGGVLVRDQKRWFELSGLSGPVEVGEWGWHHSMPCLVPSQG